MLEIEERTIVGYEHLFFAQEPTCGLKCFIAIHSTLLGPALGGVRLLDYKSEQEAIDDVLHLAKAMTYKAAVAQIGLGGGKSVIISPKIQGNARKELLLAFAAVVDTLQGSYIAAEDMGTSPEDMLLLRQKTPFVAALPTAKSSGDPSRFTAWGLVRGMQACAVKLWGNPLLQDKTIAIQGLGSVGSKVAELLFWMGAKLLFSDIDQNKVEKFCHLYGATAVDNQTFPATCCDILCPCARGGLLSQITIPQLQCTAVVGAANNLLEQHQDAQLLFERKILYAPDFVVNAGGIINASMEFTLTDYNAVHSKQRCDKIYDLLLQIFAESEQKHINTHEVACNIAEKNITYGIGKRTEPISFGIYA